MGPPCPSSFQCTPTLPTHRQAHAVLHRIDHPAGLHVAGGAGQHAGLAEPAARGGGAALELPRSRAPPPQPAAPLTPARSRACIHECSRAGSPQSAGCAPCPRTAPAQSAGRGRARTHGAPRALARPPGTGTRRRPSRQARRKTAAGVPRGGQAGVGTAARRCRPLLTGAGAAISGSQPPSAPTTCGTYTPGTVVARRNSTASRSSASARHARRHSPISASSSSPSPSAKKSMKSANGSAQGGAGGRWAGAAWAQGGRGACVFGWPRATRAAAAGAGTCLGCLLRWARRQRRAAQSRWRGSTACLAPPCDPAFASTACASGAPHALPCSMHRTAQPAAQAPEARPPLPPAPKARCSCAPRLPRGRHARLAQHFEDVGASQLVRQREAQHIKLVQRPPALHAKQPPPVARQQRLRAAHTVDGPGWAASSRAHCLGLAAASGRRARRGPGVPAGLGPGSRHGRTAAPLAGSAGRTG